MSEDKELKFSNEFSQMTKEQLEKVIRNVANEDMDAERLLSRAIRKVVKPDSFIDDVSEAYSDLCRKFLDVECEIEDDEYNLDKATYEIECYTFDMERILDEFIPKFIEKEMYMEGVRFVIAVVNSLDLSTVLSDIVEDPTDYFDPTPYYINLIEAGNWDKNEVQALVREYQYQYDKLIDVFGVYKEKAH